MGQTGKTGETGCDCFGIKAEALAAGIGRSGILPVVSTGQGFDRHQVADRLIQPVNIVIQHAVEHIDTALDPAFAADAGNPPVSGFLKLAGDGDGRCAVDADHRILRHGTATEDAFLGGDIALHIAMPVEMVRGDIEQAGNRKHGVTGQVELIRGQLEHHRIARFGQVEIEHRHTDIAADLYVLSSLGLLVQDMTDQGGCGGFAVGTGDAHMACRRLGAVQKLNIADHLGIRGLCLHYHRMRRRVGQRNAGGEDQALYLGKIGFEQIADIGTECLCLGPPVGIVIPGNNIAAAAFQRPDGGEAGTRKPHHGDGAVAADGDMVVWCCCHHSITAASGSRGRSGPEWWQ